jgi:predicted dehydrogenase
MKRLGWGILGTGRIASVFARSLQHSATGRLIAVASRSAEGLDRFCAPVPVPTRFTSYDDLLQERCVDAVYVALPHALHCEWTIRSLQSGKAVLCEKPLAMNTGEAAAMIDEARARGGFLMEAVMFRCHPMNPPDRRAREKRRDR